MHVGKLFSLYIDSVDKHHAICLKIMPLWVKTRTAVKRRHHLCTSLPATQILKLSSWADFETQIQSKHRNRTEVIFAVVIVVVVL